MNETPTPITDAAEGCILDANEEHPQEFKLQLTALSTQRSEKESK